MPVNPSTFATILGLISNFMAERRAKSDDEYKEFMEWLDTKRYKTLIDEINTNHHLGLGIKNLLKENQDLVISKLDGINKILMLVSSKVSGLSEISHAIAPNIEISNQAISILKQVNDTEASGIEERDECMGKQSPSFEFLDGDNEGFELLIEEHRFIEDDLRTLVNLRFVHPDINSNGRRVFHISRDATSFLKNVN